MDTADICFVIAIFFDIFGLILIGYEYHTTPANGSKEDIRDLIKRKRKEQKGKHKK